MFTRTWAKNTHYVPGIFMTLSRFHLVRQIIDLCREGVFRRETIIPLLPHLFHLISAYWFGPTPELAGGRADVFRLLENDFHFFISQRFGKLGK